MVETRDIVMYEQHPQSACRNARGTQRDIFCDGIVLAIAETGVERATVTGGEGRGPDIGRTPLRHVTRVRMALIHALVHEIQSRVAFLLSRSPLRWRRSEQPREQAFYPQGIAVAPARQMDFVRNLSPLCPHLAVGRDGGVRPNGPSPFFFSRRSPASAVDRRVDRCKLDIILQRPGAARSPCRANTSLMVK